MSSLSRSLRATRWQLLGVAAFTALTLIATGMVLGTIRSGSLGPTHQYSAVFSDIAGLKKGADVRIAGVRVGKVTGFELDGGRADVSFEVSSDQVVGKDSIASINFLNLMGQKYLGLDNPPGRIITAAARGRHDRDQPDPCTPRSDRVVQLFQTSL